MWSYHVWRKDQFVWVFMDRFADGHRNCVEYQTGNGSIEFCKQEIFEYQAICRFPWQDSQTQCEGLEFRLSGLETRYVEALWYDETLISRSALWLLILVRARKKIRFHIYMKMAVNALKICPNMPNYCKPTVSLQPYATIPAHIFPLWEITTFLLSAHLITSDSLPICLSDLSPFFSLVIQAHVSHGERLWAFTFLKGQWGNMFPCVSMQFNQSTLW